MKHEQLNIIIWLMCALIFVNILFMNFRISELEELIIKEGVRCLN